MEFLKNFINYFKFDIIIDIDDFCTFEQLEELEEVEQNEELEELKQNEELKEVEELEEVNQLEQPEQVEQVEEVKQVEELEQIEELEQNKELKQVGQVEQLKQHEEVEQNEKQPSDPKLLISKIIYDYFKVKLYNHQLEQIEFMLNNSEGFFNNCCGSGKTLIELGYIVVRHDRRPENVFYTGEKILVVVPRIQLLKQITNIFKCGHDDCIVSKYYTEEKNVSDITFCVNKSMMNAIEEFKNQGNTFDTFIFDEAHHDYTGLFKCESFENSDDETEEFKPFTLENVKTFYFSATLDVSKIVELNKIDKFKEYTHYEAVEENVVVPFKVWYYVIKDKNNQTEIMNSITDIINLSAYEKTTKFKSLANKILIMCNSVIDRQNSSLGVNSVFNYLKGKTKSQIYKITAETQPRQVPQILKQFETSTEQSIIVNCNCISEGTDLKCVDTVIFKDDRFSKVGLVQSAGRVIRKFNDSKKFGNLIFFVEDSQEYIDSFRKDILSLLCSYDQTVIQNSEILNKNQKFNHVHKLFIDDFEMKNMINDKITTLKYRIDILQKYIANKYYPNSKVLPYITKDTDVKLVDSMKILGKVFKITNTLYDIIEPFRKLNFMDTKILKMLYDRYYNDILCIYDLKNLNGSTPSEPTNSEIKQLANELSILFLNNIKNKSSSDNTENNFKKGKETFIYNGVLYKHKTFNLPYYKFKFDKEIFKMFLNQREDLKPNMIYYFNVNDKIYKFKTN